MWMLIQGVGMNKVTWGECLGQRSTQGVGLSLQAGTGEQRGSQLRGRERK